MSSHGRAGGRESASDPSRPEPSGDATGDDSTTVTEPVVGGAWCKGD